jgi:hypothetical protein
LVDDTITCGCDEMTEWRFDGCVFDDYQAVRVIEAWYIVFVT